MGGYILAIDQGTTSSRAVIFNEAMQPVASGQKEFPQIYPQSGWVEHDPEEIWATVVFSVNSALRKAKLAAYDIKAIGITNQRETVVVWDKASGKPVHNAIVWQDRRTAKMCARMKAEGLEKLITARTGLLADPYFSGTKLAWLLQRIPGLKRRAAKGEVLFGTIDSFLVWRLTGGKVHATDATNAARTMLFNIGYCNWDDDLLEMLGVSPAMLPQVKNCADDFGETDRKLFGAAIPILGIAGDQQAATIGQACFEPGMMKSTYGTGCFALLNTGSERVASKSRLLTTIGYRLDGKTTYAIEGSIFIAGAAVQWLRDGLKLIKSAQESGQLAALSDPMQDVILVPAFVGMGAPYWDAGARGAIYNLTRNSGPAELARAALESVAFQTSDLMTAMKKDWSGSRGGTVLRVDGGMAQSDWAMQRLADILDAPVDRPQSVETTALGAAWLAGSRAGIWPGQAGFAKAWQSQTRFNPAMGAAERKRKLKLWADAVRRTRTA